MRCGTTGERSAGGSAARARRLLARGKNIYLAGFMGTGKSAAARALARRLHVGWADLDTLIENEEGMSVTELFRARGERGFRSAEHRMLRRVARAGGRVVALGGGAVCFARNRELLRGTGPVVVLTASPEVIWKRIGASGTRPLLEGQGGYEAMRALLERRERDYRRYRRRIDTGLLTAAGVAAAVERALDVTRRRGAQAPGVRSRTTEESRR